MANGATLAYSSSVNLTKTATFVRGSTLAGTNWNGSLGGVTVSSVGSGPSFISPGNSPGNAFTTTQTWGTGGSYIWEINDFSGSAGLNPGWDLLTLSGALTISATFVLTLGWSDLGSAVGLILGGVLAAPIGAYVVKSVPVRPLMIAVAIVIITTSAIRIF